MVLLVLMRSVSLKSTFKFIVAAILTVYSFVAHAQTPGLIYKIAVNGGNKVLDPNGDGYVSKTALGFQLVNGNRLDEGPEYSEIPYRPFPVYMDEPLADLKTGGSYGHTDFAPKVYANGKLVGSPMASYFDGRNFLFRIRLAGQSSASKGYSILIDTDGKFDGSAPNPGFEFEVLLATNFDVRVIDHRTNKSGDDIIFAGSVDQYSQKAIAGSTGNGDPDYFYDFYVPMTAFKGAITEASSLRMTGVTITSAKSGIFGVTSDIGGIDDRKVQGTVVDAWKSIINNTPLSTPTDIKDTGFTPVAAFAPTVNSPLYVGGTFISGASTEPEGSKVYVYQSSQLIDSTTVGADGSWKISIRSNLLVLDRIVTAKVKPSSKSLSPSSAGIVVAAGVCSTTPPVITGATNANKGLQGTTSVAGVIKLYSVGSSTPIYTSSALAAGATWSYEFGGQGGSLTSGTYYATVTETNSCESGWSNQACVISSGNGAGNITITIPVAPQITNHTLTASSLTITGTAPSSTNIIISRNGVQLGSTTSNGSGAWTFTYNDLRNLAVGDYIYANTQITSPCTAISARSNAFTITGTSSAPVITGTYCGPTRIVKGKSTEAAGTVIKVYVNGTEVGSTTVDAFETWTAAIAERTSGTITATATAFNKTISVPSIGVPISMLYDAANLAITGDENNKTIFEGTTSVRGTAPNGALITLFISGSEYVDKDGKAITQIATGGGFIFNNISPFEIYAGAKLTVTASDPTAPNACSSTHSTPVTVQCNPVNTGMTASFTEEKYCPRTPAYIKLSSSQGGVIYNIYKKNSDGISYSPFGPSVLGTGAAITLQSDPVFADPVTGAAPILLVRTIKVGADCQFPVGGDMTVGLYPEVPKAFTVNASISSSACPNVPVTITVEKADTQHSFQLINNTTKEKLTDAIVLTANGTLSFPAQNVTKTTEYGVVIRSLITGCSTENTILKTVTVTGGPDVSRAVTISNTNVCVNGTATISVATESGYTYKVFRKGTTNQIGANLIGDGTTKSVTTGALAAGTYTYQVQVSATSTSTSTCNTYLTKEVTVQVSNGVVASAGSAQTVCSSTYLNGNDPGFGTGLWTLVSKPATALDTPKFKDATKYNTEVINLESGTYVFNWAVTSLCNNSTTNSQVTITVNCPSEYSVSTNKLVTEYINGENIATASDTEGIKSVQLLSGSLPTGTKLNTTNGIITVDRATSLIANINYNFTIRVIDQKDQITDLPLSIRFYSPTVRPVDIAPLPVELLYFTGNRNGSTVILKWATASEKNNDKFIIERSTNGKTFEAIGHVNGQGDSHITTAYTFTDKSTAANKLYYRLKQVDFDGTYTYSKIVSIMGNTLMSQPVMVAYPNPSKGMSTAILTVETASNSTITLFDLQNRVVQQQELYMEQGIVEFPVDLRNAASGIYILKVQTGNQTFQTKIVKSN